MLDQELKKEKTLDKEGLAFNVNKDPDAALDSTVTVSKENNLLQELQSKPESELTPAEIAKKNLLSREKELIKAKNAEDAIYFDEVDNVALSSVKGARSLEKMNDVSEKLTIATDFLTGGGASAAMNMGMHVAQNKVEDKGFDMLEDSTKNKKEKEYEPKPWEIGFDDSMEYHQKRFK